jgi:hypothetical protein
MRSHPPVLGQWWLRALVVGGLVVGHVAIIALGFWFLIWLFAPHAFFALVAVFVAAVVVAGVVGVGQWAGGWWRAVQIAAAVGLCAFYVVAALYEFNAGIGDLATRAAIGTPATDIGLTLAIGAGAIVAIGVLIAVLPLPVSPRTAGIAAAITVVTGLGCAFSALAVGAGTDTCDRFRVDPARWRAALRAHPADAERMARAIDNCGTIDGARRGTVRLLLGESGAPRGREWSWHVGASGGLFGHFQEFIVEFGRDNRVRRAYVRLGSD